MGKGDQGELLRIDSRRSDQVSDVIPCPGLTSPIENKMQNDSVWQI